MPLRRHVGKPTPPVFGPRDLARLLNRIPVGHQVKSDAPFIADRNLRAWTSSWREEAFETRRRHHTSDRQAGLLAGVAYADPQPGIHVVPIPKVLTKMDQMRPRLLRRENTTTLLVLGHVCPSTIAAITMPPLWWKASSASRLGRGVSEIVDTLATSECGRRQGWEGL